MTNAQAPTVQARVAAAVDLISIPDAARRLGLHPDTLYRLCRTGQFPPAIQIGGRWRVSVPRLERYLHGSAES
jgi:excisionase family DNA binding protein